MKRNYFLSSLALLFLLITGCSKDQTNTFSAAVTASIGGASFTSTGGNVNVGEHAPVSGGAVGGTEIVDITASGDAATANYLVIDFGYAANDVKSYSIPTKQAICAYHKSGAASDDIATFGTVTITKNDVSDVSNGKHIEGAFDFTTQLGVHIIGTFSVQVNY